MGKTVLAIIIGLLVGAFAAWWWVGGGHPRTLAQPSEHLAGWSVVTSTQELASASGGTTWSVSAEVRLRNISTKGLKLNVPAQRFLVVLADGSTVVGNLPDPVSSSISAQETTSVVLPVVSFFSRSRDIASVLLALDEGDGLRLVAAPVGEEPKPPKPAEPAK